MYVHVSVSMPMCVCVCAHACLCREWGFRFLCVWKVCRKGGTSAVVLVSEALAVAAAGMFRGRRGTTAPRPTIACYSYGAPVQEASSCPIL